MIENYWKKITLVCGNHPGEDEEIMTIHEGAAGKTPFYTCPRYVSVLKKCSCRSCNNRFSIQEMQHLINKLEHMIKDPLSPYAVNLTGYKWTEKGTDYEILKQESGEIRISILNRKAMSR